MKNLIMAFFCMLSVTTSCASCSKGNDAGIENNQTENLMPKPTGNKMKIIIGNRSFTATLYDSPTVTAFKGTLPITLDMDELNGNEKKFNLPRSLPANASNPGTIHNGDLMLYGSSTLVLFYKEFATSYSYTRLGRIDDPSGLAAALGKKNVVVTFQLKD